MPKYLKEALLIIFSVLFALFINKLFESYQLEKEKEIALNSIYQEIEENARIIKEWQERHDAMGQAFFNIMTGKGDSLKQELKKYRYLNLAVITEEETLVDEFLTKTAWETAKTTGIVKEFDFETNQEFTRIYLMQDLLMEKTLGKVTDYFFDSEAHDMEQLDKVIVQLSLRFLELTGQEKMMSQYYEEALENQSFVEN